MAYSEEHKRAIKSAWVRGRLRYKLDANQKGLYDQIQKSDGGVFYVNWPRRVGKSFAATLIAIEYAIRHPGAQIKYAAPTAKSVRKIVGPNFKRILADCPNALRPEWNREDGEYRFKNGSVVSVAGCDNQNYESLRGTEAHLVIVDEAGFMDDLSYIVDDVLSPMTQDTEGKIIITSTPPRSPAHEAVNIAKSCKMVGDYAECTIFDNPRLSPEKRDRFLRKIARGRDLETFCKSATFRREYMAEFLIDEEIAVIPEWTTEVEKKLVHVFDRPAWADRYTSLDIGWKDGMGLLFGFWDRSTATLYIEDEWLKFRVNTKKMADAVKEKERELWAGERPYLRIADNDLLTIHDLSSEHDLVFVPTAKDHKELQVDNLRRMVEDGSIVIHPRCLNLIKQMSTTVWNKSRTSFERTEDGHGDLIDALVYLVRNIRRTREQNRQTENKFNEDEFIMLPQSSNTKSADSILRLFKVTTGKA